MYSIFCRAAHSEKLFLQVTDIHQLKVISNSRSSAHLTVTTCLSPSLSYHIFPAFLFIYKLPVRTKYPSLLSTNAMPIKIFCAVDPSFRYRVDAFLSLVLLGSFLTIHRADGISRNSSSEIIADRRTSYRVLGANRTIFTRTAE